MVRIRKGQPVLREEVLAVLAICEADPRPSGARDAALLCLFAGHGLWPAAVESLRVECYDAEQRCLRAAGRGRHPASVTRLGDQASRAMDRWIAVRGLQTGPLFLATGRNETLTSNPIGRQTISQTLIRRCHQAAVLPFTPDDLIRTAALLRCGCWTRSAECARGSQPFVNPRASPLLEGTDEGGASDAHVDRGRRQVVNFLRRLPTAERQFTLDAVTEALEAIGFSDTNPFLFDWRELGTAELLQIGDWLGRQESHRRRRSWRALIRLLRATGPAGGGLRPELLDAAREVLHRGPPRDTPHAAKYTPPIPRRSLPADR